MPISFECSDCGATLKVKEQYSGRRIKCPHCEAAIRVPVEEEESDDDTDDEEVVSRPRKAATSSRSKPSGRSQPRRSRSSDDDGSEQLPASSKRKKKKSSAKAKSGSGGKVPMWAIAAGSGLACVLVIGIVVFIATKPTAQAANAQAAGGAQPEQAKVVQAQVDGPGAKFRMKFEMPLNWTSEGSIEDEMFPWATLKGQGQSIKLSSNRSLAGGAEAMTTMGGAIEQLKMSHTNRGTKLQAENTDWVDGPLGIHEGKHGPVVWNDYEYKGVFSKGYGIRCTIDGPVRPCTLMLECGESARDKWRPTLLAIAESIYFVGMKNGQEDRDDFGGDFGRDAVDNGPGEAMPDADPAEMDADTE